MYKHHEFHVVPRRLVKGCFCEYPGGCVRRTVNLLRLRTGGNGRNILQSSKAEIKIIIYGKNIYRPLFIDHYL